MALLPGALLCTACCPHWQLLRSPAQHSAAAGSSAAACVLVCLQANLPPSPSSPTWRAARRSSGTGTPPTCCSACAARGGEPGVWGVYVGGWGGGVGGWGGVGWAGAYRVPMLQPLASGQLLAWHGVSTTRVCCCGIDSCYCPGPPPLPPPRRYAELKSLNVNPANPQQLAVAASDPLLRIYDRRMLSAGACAPDSTLCFACVHLHTCAPWAQWAQQALGQALLASRWRAGRRPSSRLALPEANHTRCTLQASLCAWRRPRSRCWRWRRRTWRWRPRRRAAAMAGGRRACTRPTWLGATVGTRWGQVAALLPGLHTVGGSWRAQPGCAMSAPPLQRSSARHASLPAWP